MTYKSSDTSKLFNAKGYTANKGANIKHETNLIVGDYMSQKQKNVGTTCDGLISYVDEETAIEIEMQ